MAASLMCRISREELQLLALSINPVHYWTLGVVLGFHPKTVYKLDKKHGEGALLKILSLWVDQHGEGVDVRGLLAEKLIEAGLEAQWNKLPGAHSPSGPSLVLGINDQLLINVADNIETGEQVQTLGLALGFNRAALNRYLETNRQEGRMTSKGTRDMLFDWRQNTDPAKQPNDLAQALRRSHLVTLETEYLKDVKIRDGSRQGTAATHNLTSGLSDRLIADIASDIETKEQFASLGGNLQFDREHLTRYQEDNHVEGRVTYRGTRNMLYDWKQRVPQCDQRRALRRALIQSGLDKLAEHHLNETDMMFDVLDDINITEDFTAGECRRRLIRHYKTSLCKVQIKPWDKSSMADVKDIFTFPTIYKKDANGKNIGEQENVLLQGSVDEIFKATVNGTLPFRIVLLADAGKGNSTTVAKMVHDWVHQIEGSAFEHLPLLFRVKLRKAIKHMSLAEAIISQNLRGIKGLTPELLEHFIRHNQNLCWILLDGLDEYSGLSGDLSLSSSLGSIAATLHYNDLQDCRVLVTCRPHLENYFDQGQLPSIYAKMVIEGFGKEQSIQYIDRYFSDEVKRQRVKEYLSNHDVIKELVAKPLFCLMVCYLSSVGFLEGIETQTQLFDRVNLFLWQHSINRGDTISKDELQETILGLGKVALHGMLHKSNTHSFSPKDFHKVPAALINGRKLGIVSESVPSEQGSCTDLSDGPYSCIEFYSTSALEHAAGKYLASEAGPVLMKLKMSKLDTVLRKIRGSIGQYEDILRFAAGSDGEVCVRIMQEILSNKSISESQRFRLLSDFSTEAARLKHSVSSIVRCCIKNGNVVLDSPTAHDDLGLKNLSPELKQEIRSVELQNCELTTSLSRTLTEGLETLPHLDHVTVSQPSDIRSLPTFGSISSLKLQDFPESFFEGHGWLNGAGDLQNLNVTFTVSGDVSGKRKQCKSESSLQLTQGGMTLSNATAKTIKVVENIPQDSLNKIEKFRMKETKLTDDMTKRLWSCLATFSSLTCLTIENSSLTFSLQAPTLPSIRSLTVTHISPDMYRGLFRSLPDLNRIFPLRINEDIPHIALGLRDAEAIVSRLVLSGWLAGDRRVSNKTMSTLCETVQGTTTVREVWLLDLTIHEEDLITLIEACRTVRAMERIDLNRCGSIPGGLLEVHLQRVKSQSGSKDGINVLFTHETHTKVAYVPHIL